VHHFVYSTVRVGYRQRSAPCASACLTGCARNGLRRKTCGPGHLRSAWMVAAGGWWMVLRRCGSDHRWMVGVPGGHYPGWWRHRGLCGKAGRREGRHRGNCPASAAPRKLSASFEGTVRPGAADPRELSWALRGPVRYGSGAAAVGCIDTAMVAMPKQSCALRSNLGLSQAVSRAWRVDRIATVDHRATWMAWTRGMGSVAESSHFGPLRWLPLASVDSKCGNWHDTAKSIRLRSS
jgi:hypothetical protein